MKNKILSVAGLLIVVFSIVFLSAHTYAALTNSEISACIKENGVLHVISPEFKREECKNKETLLTWNSQGIKGDAGLAGIQGEKGDQGPAGPQGEPGINASNGAGNIAFILGDYILKTDGTVWVAKSGSGNIPDYLKIDGNNYSGVTNVPIPITDIIVWQYTRLVDKDGNYWAFQPFGTDSQGHRVGGWQNFGPLP